MTKPRVAYLFGAGASANALPMVRDMPLKMEEHAETIRGYREVPPPASVKLHGNMPWQSAIDQYANAMHALAENAKGHESVDTYAKKLYFGYRRTEAELKELKILLTTFFSFLQRPACPIDSRYDGFFASLLVDGGSVPKVAEDVIMLSWNYDLQIPRAFGPYWGDDRIDVLMESLGVTTLDRLSSYQRTPRLIHLNGIAAWENSRTLTPVLPVDASDDIERVGWLLQHFLVGKESWEALVVRHRHYLTMLRFAWEGDAQTSSGLEKLKEYLSECETLVVIGYSFPFFNRPIDRELIGRMSKLKKVYIQTTPLSVRGVTNAFRAIPLGRELEVEAYDSVDKFLLPPEL